MKVSFGVLPASRALAGSRRGRPIAIVVTALAIALTLASAHAQAPDVANHPDIKYPDIQAQWTRLGSAQWDPSKPAGRGQQVPFTPEFAAIFDAILAGREKSGLDNNATASCIPSRMPRTMIVYATLE